MINFKAMDLEIILNTLKNKKTQGVFQINVSGKETESTLSQFIVLREDRIVYGGSDFPTPEKLATEIGKKLEIKTIASLLKTTANKIEDKDSFEELFGLFQRFGLIKPEQLRSLLEQETILTLERILPYAGSIIPCPELKFDLSCEGILLSELFSKLEDRKNRWSKLLPIVESIESIPSLAPNALNKISHISISNHCKKWIDGNRSIVDIATVTKQDPLKLATEYYKWEQRGWISFSQTSKTESYDLSSVNKSIKDSPSDNSQTRLSTILSVDDSPIVQTMIKRAVKDRYNLLTAGNAMDGLHILNSNKDKIRLLLLDVTMPDIDGMELCRTIRKMKHFEKLPIVMLTAKDGMLDKFKGKFVGSSEYLTKPVNREQLLQTIGKYVSVN